MLPLTAKPNPFEEVVQYVSNKEELERKRGVNVGRLYPYVYSYLWWTDRMKLKEFDNVKMLNEVSE